MEGLFPGFTGATEEGQSVLPSSTCYFSSFFNPKWPVRGSWPLVPAKPFIIFPCMYFNVVLPSLGRGMD